MFDNPTMPSEVAEVYRGFPEPQASELRDVRQLILQDAERLDAGPVTETLKWGQPSYLVKKGTTLRLSLIGARAAIFVHCQTTLIEQAREMFGSVAEFSDNRALILGGDPRAVTHVIAAALTYHQKKR